MRSTCRHVITYFSLYSVYIQCEGFAKLTFYLWFHRTPRPKTPSTPRGALPAGWAATLDMSSGETYYYNEETGETQWEVPEHDKRLSTPRKQPENTW